MNECPKCATLHESIGNEDNLCDDCLQEQEEQEAKELRREYERSVL